MAATIAKPISQTKVTETYRKGEPLISLETVYLSYFLSFKAGATGPHTVVREPANAESMDVIVDRFATVEEARAAWKAKRGRLLSRGFVKVQTERAVTTRAPGQWRATVKRTVVKA